ncbi:probable E3 ubiquitin-protein ligase HERC3 isoform X1 [Brachyistius frenatus]|uniref:probable E3 ubiquitin-protein ligase HERC3 isoform X1 n=1 Tax=Brachyistius frenatus TaxID=100188 RepID=UPI0037E8DB3A
MFSWGEDRRQGFYLKKDSSILTADGVHFLNLNFDVKDLSAGRGLLAFVKSSGEAFIIQTDDSGDERAVRGKQKFVMEKIKSVSCGDTDVVTLLSKRGIVFCVDTTRSPFKPSPPQALCDIPVSQVACGSQHTVALTKGGQLFTWGQDSRGQLGLGGNGSNSPQYVRSLSGIPLVQIAAGGEHSFALSFSGGAFGWGRNDHGQLGLGDATDRNTPTHVHFLNTKKTVHISCGKDHTAALTKGGGVFTFGSGRYGQLGHNSTRNELRPRLVAELWGAKVTKIACGRHHTLVLTDPRRVYSFGCGHHGQLGHRPESHPSVPLPVRLPRGPRILNIYAGGNCSFATRTPNEAAHRRADVGANNAIDGLIDRWSSEGTYKSSKKTLQGFHAMFSSASCINRSFLDQSQDKHFRTSPKHSGLDLSLAQRHFEKLGESGAVLAEVETAVLEMLVSLDVSPVVLEGLRIFQLLTELLNVIQKDRRDQSFVLADKVAAAIHRLPAESFQIIVGWWSSLSPSTMIRHVEVWKKALSQILSIHNVPRASINNMLLILQNMYNANKMKKIPETTFASEINQMFLQEDLQRWGVMQTTQVGNNPPLILGEFPFLMDVKSKKYVFDVNITCTQWEHQWLPQATQKPFFELKLTRALLLEGTFTQLAAAHHSALKKPLVVYFDENPKLTDVYKRDFFHHLFPEIMSPNFGMFKFNDSKTLAWFPSTQPAEDKPSFYLFGVLCGLALYNQSIIYLPFPLALFKKLLNIQPSLEDLMDFDPRVGRSLQDILKSEDKDLEDLYLDFWITWDGVRVDLDPQNPEKLVTGQNKKEFVEAYVNHIFNTSVESLYQEFERGFFQVCNRDLLRLFRPEELQGVLVGQDVYDWANLKKNTVYEAYYRSHPTIQMFWEVFGELTEDQRKDFILFLTGSRRVPILGMDQIRMRVQVSQILNGSHDQHMPEALTCHSLLQLPLYSTKEIMRDQLIEALKEDTGFSKS